MTLLLGLPEGESAGIPHGLTMEDQRRQASGFHKSRMFPTPHGLGLDGLSGPDVHGTSREPGRGLLGTQLPWEPSELHSSAAMTPSLSSWPCCWQLYRCDQFVVLPKSAALPICGCSLRFQLKTVFRKMLANCCQRGIYSRALPKVAWVRNWLMWSARNMGQRTTCGSLSGIPGGIPRAGPGACTGQVTIRRALMKAHLSPLCFGLWVGWWTGKQVLLETVRPEWAISAATTFCGQDAWRARLCRRDTALKVGSRPGAVWLGHMVRSEESQVFHIYSLHLYLILVCVFLWKGFAY